jgi:hypothetical protein
LRKKNLPKKKRNKKSPENRGFFVADFSVSGNNTSWDGKQPLSIPHKIFGAPLPSEAHNTKNFVFLHQGDILPPRTRTPPCAMGDGSCGDNFARENFIPVRTDVCISALRRRTTP